MPHRYIQLPFRAECFGPSSATHVTVALPAISARVELATGTVVSERGGHQRRPPADASLALRPLAERRTETAAGPTTELSDGEGVSTRLDGELSHAWRSGRSVVAVVSMPGRQAHVVAFVVGEPVRQRLPAAWHAPVAGGSRFAACALEGMTHVFRFDGHDVRSVSLASPPSFCRLGPDLFVDDARVCVLAGDKLLVIDANALDFAQEHAALPVRYEPMVAAGASDRVPATVAIVLAQTILVDHPRLKRLRLARAVDAPPVAPGDRVIIDDVREELPGVFRVHAWHKAGATTSVRPAAAPIELTAPLVALPTPSVAEHVGEAAATRVPDSERLRYLAARHGFGVSETLMRLLRTRESDQVFSRWLDKLGLDAFEVRGLTGDWDADPSLVAICGLGNGDEYCLYVYPPWCSVGNEPPVVEFLHETNFVHFRALTFEAFFDAELARRVDEEGADRELVRMVREQLQFPATKRSVGEPPAWLPLDSAQHAGGAPRDRAVATIDRALDLEKHGHVLDAERALLNVFLQPGDSSRLAAVELQRIYTQLGWGLALEHLAARGRVEP